MKDDCCEFILFRFKFDIDEVVSHGSCHDLVACCCSIGSDHDGVFVVECNDDEAVQSCCFPIVGVGVGVFFSGVPIPRKAFNAFEESTSRVTGPCDKPPIAQIEGPLNMAGSEAYECDAALLFDVVTEFDDVGTELGKGIVHGSFAKNEDVCCCCCCAAGGC